MEKPTVYIVIEGEAIAFDKNGEIVCTNDWDTDLRPMWEHGGLADDRGAGGREGYRALHEALTWAEENAQLCGLELVRVATPE